MTAKLKTAIDPVRIAQVKMLMQVLECGAKSNVVSRHVIEQANLDAVSGARATGVMYAVIHNLPIIDAWINHFSKGSLAKLEPEIRTIMRLACFELKCQTVNAKAYATVNQAVALARHFTGERATSFVNANLRAIDRHGMIAPFKVTDAMKYGFSAELYGLLVKWFGKERAKAIAQTTLASFKETTLRLVSRHCPQGNIDNLLRLLSERRYAFTPSSIGLPNSVKIELKGRSLTDVPCYRQNAFFVQDEAASLLGEICIDSSSCSFLDVCAAPGGKTVDIGLRLPDNALIEALDLSSKRLLQVEEMGARFLKQKVITSVADATMPLQERCSQAEYDIVLADVPCSGLGVMGRKPEMKTRLRYEEIMAFAPRQLAILQNASAMVRYGGDLIYSTCTINPHENILLVKEFLQTDAGRAFELVDLTAKAKVYGIEASEGCVALFPDCNPCDGFFIAKFKRQPTTCRGLTT